MRKFVYLVLPFFLFSCQKDQESGTTSDSSSAIAKDLEKLGFHTEEGFYPFEDGYIVEYDIFLRPQDVAHLIQEKAGKQVASIPTATQLNASNKEAPTPKDGTQNTAHYRTREIVQIVGGSQTRLINVYADPALGTKVGIALGEAAARYNALNIKLRFTQVYNLNEADIALRSVSKAPFLMAAGFPSNNNPHAEILVNVDDYNDRKSRADIVSTIAHEIGHCIGFRHTDYMDRRFSCNPKKTPYNEGQSAYGALHIPGTAINPEQDSWMLACSPGYDRPFTMGDITALRQVYPL